MSESKPIQIVIDGSRGEGGGQILRNAITYACIMKVPLKVHSIRAGRTKPGLRAQHKTSLDLAIEICGGSLAGAQIGSDCIQYDPKSSSLKDTNHTLKEINERQIHTAIGTAGSISLLLQVALPCVLFPQHHSCVNLQLEGGTHVEFSPQIDYIKEVFLPIITRHCCMPVRSIGSDDSLLDLETQMTGYYPFGGGVINLRISQLFERTSKPLLLLERGSLHSIHIKSFYGGRAPRSVAVNIARAALEFMSKRSSLLNELNHITPTIEIVQHNVAKGSGTGIVIITKTNTNCIFGSCALGNRKIKPQLTGEKAAKEMVDTLLSGGCVDDWLSDQLILFMALAHGESKMLTGALTPHAMSAIHVATEMTKAKFRVEKIGEPTELPGGKKIGKHIISCIGAGSSLAETNN